MEEGERVALCSNIGYFYCRLFCRSKKYCDCYDREVKKFKGLIHGKNK